MTRTWIGAALLAAACHGDDGEGKGTGKATDGPTDTDPVETAHTGDTGTTEPVPTGDTGTEPTEPSISASCLPQLDNPLRFECDVTVSPAAEVEIAFSKADGSGVERVHASGRVGTRHTVFLYFLAPETDYEWEARPIDDPLRTAKGTVTTGALPAIAKTTFASTGTTTAKLVGMVAPCQAGTAIVVDPATAEVVWYDRMAWNNGGQLEAVTFTEDDTVLGLGGGGIVERDWSGQKLLDLAPGVDLPNRVHHDVFKRAGLVYAIFSEAWTSPLGQDVSVDGFYVIDPILGIQWEWHLRDFVTPTVAGSPFTVDWSHGNSVWADADQDVIVSYRHLSAVVRVEGDPASPDFGQPLWMLSGQASSDVASDFRMGSALPVATDFYQQHNVHLLPDGTLTMFDNREGPEDSRIVDLALDEVAGTATIVRVYPLPAGPPAGHCDFQGGALRTAAGNPMATCAPNRTGIEFDAATGEVLWTATASCDGGGSSYIPRFVPLDL